MNLTFQFVQLEPSELNNIPRFSWPWACFVIISRYYQMKLIHVNKIATYSVNFNTPSLLYQKLHSPGVLRQNVKSVALVHQHFTLPVPNRTISFCIMLINILHFAFWAGARWSEHQVVCLISQAPKSQSIGNVLLEFPNRHNLLDKVFFGLRVL
jgi:hypothetical protein